MVEEHVYLLNFLPFGVGQFQNGDTTKGIIIAVSQVVLGAVNIGAILAHNAIADDPSRRCSVSTPTNCSNPPIPDSDRALLQNIDIVKYVSAGLFWGVYAYGVADSLVHYVPRIETEITPGQARPSSSRGTSRRTRVAELVVKDGEGAPRSVRSPGGSPPSAATRRATCSSTIRPCRPPRSTSSPTATTTPSRPTPACELTVNGRRRTTCRLAPGDVLRAGGHEILFSPPLRPRPPRRRRTAVAGGAAGPLLPAAARGRLARSLLDALLDALLEVTRADKGFVIELADGTPEVRAARNVARATSRTRSRASPTPSSRRWSRPAVRWWWPTPSTTRSGPAPPRW